jgi:hypothetical protein
VQAIPMVVQRMLRIIEKAGYRFLVGIASAGGDRPMLLIAEKDGQWRGIEADISGYKPSAAKFLLRLMLEPCPTTVSEIMSSVAEFADKYRGMVVWVTNAI